MVHPPKDGEMRHDIHRACSLLLRLLSGDVLELCLQLKGFHYVINRWVSLFFQIPDFWGCGGEETTKLDEARFPFFAGDRPTDLPNESRSMISFMSVSESNLFVMQAS